MNARRIGSASTPTLLVIAAALLFSVPCYAQQPNLEQLKLVASSLTAESAKRGENALFQVCGANNRYSLCITFPGADATDFAQRIYGNSDFAKKAAHEGFTAALIRNATTDKALSQNYAMNVTEEGWAANDKYIHDPAEEIAVLLATNQRDPAKSIIAFRAFLQRYPNSVAKEGILNRLMVAERQAGDNDGSIATAKQLLAIVDASDPVRVEALWEVVHLSMVEAAAGTNTVQNATQAKEYSEKGMQALDQIKRPESMSEEQFATSQSNFRVFFQGVIGADKAPAAAVNENGAQTANSNSPTPGPQSLNSSATAQVGAKQSQPSAIAGTQNPTANYPDTRPDNSAQSPAPGAAAGSDAAAIPGRLSGDQLKAILAEADEESRKAFSDLVEQTAVLPTTLESILEAARRRNWSPDSTPSLCMQKISSFQGRLGKSLHPKRVEDIVAMNQLFNRTVDGQSNYCRGNFQSLVSANLFSIFTSVSAAVDVEEQRQEQIEDARKTIIDLEGALNGGDLSSANQLYQRLLYFVSSLVPFAQSYLQETQSLRQDLNAYSQAVDIDHFQSVSLSDQLQKLSREVNLLHQSAERPLTQAYLQHAIKDCIDSARQQLAKLPTLQFNETPYRIPSGISENRELALVSNDIKTIDESLARVSEVRAIIAQPGAMKAAEEVIGGNEAAALNATANQIGLAEHMRASLVDTQNSLQTKIAAEQQAEQERIEAKQRAEAQKEAEAEQKKQELAAAEEQKKAAEGVALRRSIALSLGLHSGQSQAEVKAILTAQGYRRPVDLPGTYDPWICDSDGWKGGVWNTTCQSRKADVTVSLVFELGKMYRDPDTGALRQVRTDRLFFTTFDFAKYEFPNNRFDLVSPTLDICHGGDDGDAACLNF